MTKNQYYREISLRIISLADDIDTYNKLLNNFGVWVFLATLACWSVENTYIQLIALIFSFIIASHQLITQLPSLRLFRRREASLSKKIEHAPVSEKYRKKLYFQLSLAVKKASISNQLLGHPAYYLSMIFICISLYHWWVDNT